MALAPDEINLALWVEDARAGDRVAFRRIVREFMPRIRSYVHQLGYQSLADDVTQETFLKAWINLPSLRDGRVFKTWLYRIATNEVMDVLRKTRSEKSVQVVPADSIGMSIDPGLGILVRNGLAGLSDEHRTVLMLHEVEGFTEKEIASMMDVPRGTVKSRLFHAKQTMRSFLERAGMVRG